MGLSLKERLPTENIAPCPGGEIFLYRVGALSMSVCAPGDLARDDVSKHVEAHMPCGTEAGWTVSSDTKFSGGEPMPCQCQETPDRKHWLLDA